jgi:hypothetical protein
MLDSVNCLRFHDVSGTGFTPPLVDFNFGRIFDEWSDYYT